MAIIASVVVVLLMCLDLQGSCTRQGICKNSLQRFSKVDRKFSNIAVGQEHMVATDALRTGVKAKQTHDSKDIRYSKLGYHTPPLTRVRQRGIEWKFRWKWSGQRNWRLSSSLSKGDIIDEFTNHKKLAELSKKPLAEVTVRPLPYGGKFYGGIGRAIAWIKALTEASEGTPIRCAEENEQCSCRGKVYLVQKFVHGKELEYQNMMSTPEIPYSWDYVIGSAACVAESFLRMRYLQWQSSDLQCFCDEQPILAFQAFTQQRKSKGYEVKEQVADGGYGRILSASELGSSAEVIVKFVPFENQRNHSLGESQEVKLQKKVESPFVPRIHGEYRVGGHWFIVMDKAEGTDLHKYLNRVKYKIEESTARAIVVQLAMAVQGCHKRNIVHRDIKPENIMYNPDKEFDPDSIFPKAPLMLIDFGLAAERKIGYLSGFNGGTLHYAAPEILKSTSHWEAVDIWSMGVVLYRLACLGEFPFDYPPQCREKWRPDFCRRALVWNIMHQPLKFPNEMASWASQVKDLIVQMLQKDQSMRIEIKGVLEDPWVINR